MKQNYRELFKAELSRELHVVFPYYNNKRIKARLNGKSPVKYQTLSIKG